MINALPINSAPIGSELKLGSGKLLSVSAGAGAATAVAVAVQRALAVSVSGGMSAVSVSALRTRGFGATLTARVKKIVSDMDLYKSATGQTMTYLSADLCNSGAITPTLTNQKNFGANLAAGVATAVAVAVQRALGASVSALATLFESGFYSRARMSASLSVSGVVTRKERIRVTFTDFFVNVDNPGLVRSRGLGVLAAVGASIAAPVLAWYRSLAAAVTAGASIVATLFKTENLATDGDCTATADFTAQMVRVRGLGASISAGASTDNVELFVNEFAPAPSARILRVPFRWRRVIVPPRVRQDIVEPH